MRTHLRRLAGFGFAVGLVVMPVAPANAGTVTFPVDSWTVTVTIPDYTYISNDCEKAPWTADIQGPAYNYFSINATASPSATASPPSPSPSSSLAPAALSGSMIVCGGLSGYGTFDVAGEATVMADSVTHKAPFATTFVINPMATTAILSGYRPSGQYDWTLFEGRVVAHSTTLGDIGAYPTSNIVIEEQVGAGPWTAVTSVRILDSQGGFSITMYRSPTPGASYRASYLATTLGHSTSCAPSVSNSIQAPPAQPAPPAPAPPATPTPQALPSPTVSAKAVSHASKLRVDVNPNKGKGYWTFQVQRKAADGSWVTLGKTYKTQGSKETRTINLKRGTYRVVVLAKYGYQSATSPQVYLKK